MSRTQKGRCIHLSVNLCDHVQDPEGTVQKLAKFLQVKADDQLCADIAKACSFGKMKEADKKKELPEHFKDNFPEMYRKGQSRAGLLLFISWLLNVLATRFDVVCWLLKVPAAR